MGRLAKKLGSEHPGQASSYSRRWPPRGPLLVPSTAARGRRTERGLTSVQGGRHILRP